MGRLHIYIYMQQQNKDEKKTDKSGTYLQLLTSNSILHFIQKKKKTKGVVCQ